MSGMRSAHISYQAVQCRYHQSFSSSRGQKVTSRAAIWLNGLISSTFIFAAIPKISNLSVDKNSCTNGKRTLANSQCSQAHQRTKKMDALSNVHSNNIQLSISVFIQQITMPVDTPNNQQYPRQLMLSNYCIPSADWQYQPADQQSYVLPIQSHHPSSPPSLLNTNDASLISSSALSSPYE